MTESIGTFPTMTNRETNPEAEASRITYTREDLFNILRETAEHRPELLNPPAGIDNSVLVSDSQRQAEISRHLNGS